MDRLIDILSLEEFERSKTQEKSIFMFILLLAYPDRGLLKHLLGIL